jgi:sugar lactone lactonase YvrE
MRALIHAGLPAVVVALILAGSAQAERIVLVAGGGSRTDTAPAKEAKLISPFGIDFTSEGDAYLVELAGGRLLKLSRQGLLSTLAGEAEQKGSAGDGGPAAAARFNGMHSLAVAKDGTVYLADTWNNRIRKYDPRTGRIEAVAGSGDKGDDAGGKAVDAKLGGLYSIDLDASGQRLYMADLDNRRVRVLDLESGKLETVAGNGQKGLPNDGDVAREAPLVDPRAVAVDSQGNVYILERGGHALRVVDRQGKIRTVVGTGKRGLSGDGSLAREATMNGPKHLCVDPQDNVIIADTENHVIRKYLPKNGTIVRIAGTGKKGTGGLGGSPLEVELNQPHGVYLHRSGELYIVDSSNNRVLKIEQ